MVGWHYILAITFLSIYISAWLGVEIIADSRKYKVTHLQMSIIPLICILAIPFMGYNNYSTTIIPIASRFYKKKRVHIFLTITIRKFIIWEYLIYQGKMPLCLWAFNQVNRAAKRSNELDFHKIREVIGCMEKKLIMQSRPDYQQMKAQNYTIETEKNSVQHFDTPDLFPYYEKNFIPMERKCHEVIWNYAR